MTVEQDEKFKAAAHGLFLGCAMPIVAYNVARRQTRNKFNVAVYLGFLAFEVFQIVNHLRDARVKSPDATARC